MADYYLKNADATRIYRLDYEVGADGAVLVKACRAAATGASAVLPNKESITMPDQPVDVSQCLVDFILNALKPATVTEYRTRAKAMLDTFWS